MAITLTQKINGSVRTVQLNKGLKIRHVRATLAAGTDYTVGTGFAGITPAACGMRVIWGVLGATIRTSGNSIRVLIPLFDYNTGFVRFFEQEAAAPLAEIETGDLAANDIIDCLVVGM